MQKDLLRDIAIYAIPAFINRGLSFFLIPLYTRILQPYEYGTLDILLVFGNLVNLTIALEVSQGVARYCSAEKDVHQRAIYASSALWFSLISYGTFFILGISFSHTFSAWILNRTELTSTFQISLVYITLNGIFLLVSNQFRWELRSRNYAISSFLVSLVTAISGVTLAYYFGLRLNGLLLGMISGTTIGLLYSLWYLRQSFCLYFDSKYLYKMLCFSLPLVPSGISIFISNYLDRLMINHYLSLEEVGLYGLAFRVSSVVSLVMIGFQNALTPLIYNNYSKPKTPRELASIFRIFTAIALLIFLTLSIFSNEIFHWFLPPNYYQASRLVILIVPAILLSSMYIFAPGIDLLKKTHLILWINFSGAILNVLLNYLLIPKLGTIGAATATLSGYAASFTTYMSFSQKFYYVPHDFKKLLCALAIVTILTIIGIHVNIENIYFNLVCKTILVGVSIVFLNMIDLIKIKDVRNILNTSSTQE